MIDGETSGVAMRLSEVRAVLTGLREANCQLWIAGGWGVDALVGRQTRPHRDLDLAVDAKDETAALDALGRLGYIVETDWRPVRVELIAANRGWVDLHPVAFDRTGHGRQTDLAGGHFEYPPEAFTVGTLDGVAVPCLSRGQQVRFHRGYEPRPADLHDLKQLERLPGKL
ncbi:MAG: nucleotidyltransferase domain-containing protein [Sciscionella sp.]